METASPVQVKQSSVLGLSEAEVKERVSKGLTNKTDLSSGKTTKEIIVSNAFTYFNLIFLVIAILLCVIGSFRNLTFLPLVIANTLVGIIQELRAKKTIEKMSLLNAPHAIALRDGAEKKITADELVRDDVILLSAGDQICADAVVLAGNVFVNESLLTGESDEIEKTGGAKLMSGSFVVSGKCYAKLEKVGNDSYISKLTKEAKELGTKEESEMIRSINKIIKAAGIIIVPIGAVLFIQSHFVNGETVEKGVVSAVAAVLGMIPEGLYMLTTIALALGTIRLVKNKVLLHDMKSIETLARVDVLCVDKTGTITEPDMTVNRVIPFEGCPVSEKEFSSLLSDYVLSSNDNNATMNALSGYIKGKDPVAFSSRIARKVNPFSSSTKYGTIVFDDGVYALGAPEFVMKDGFGKVSGEISAYTEAGYRVIIFARADSEELKSPEPLGFVVLSNPIRENAKSTFSYFREQGVAIKVISGDNPKTVSEVAKEAGIENADKYIDAAQLDTDEKIASAVETYTVFGRVTPKQKQKFVKALQKSGHTVAMTGDGVNDILAMKDADCSVAMASGSEAAAQAAQVVLMDSDFAHMPDVVFEGRRVVNNIQRSASLFLVKNIFSLLLSIFSAIFMLTYPLEPAQISLITTFTIGFPGFLLALEPNKNRIEGNFLKNVFLKAFPGGLTDLIAVGSLAICGDVFALSSEDIGTSATMILSVVGLMILVNISRPMNKLKYGVLAINVGGLVVSGIFLKQLFALSEMSAICILLTVIFAFAAESLFRNLTWCVEEIDKKWLEFREKHPPKKKAETDDKRKRLHEIRDRKIKKVHTKKEKQGKKARESAHKKRDRSQMKKS